ncbi:hypothetical protein JTE90_024006 [Oedothorax gibbosus]|uniref:EGF-like domain-containing protein n=1 Tax=Oedothorax gibbosus TaxID=931172 RepID=A0AAV6VBA4_9ARAC|nr:hypothetical protein JTE90_024006 [Oedothorax gibbosus]
MIINKILIGLCLISGVICLEKSTVSDVAVTENSSPNDESTTGNVLTDVDTDGDVILTSGPELPELETEDDSANATTLNATEDIKETTIITLPTTTELVTIPVEIHVSPCASNPCKNGGLCQEDPSSNVPYQCNCTSGYTGTHCQVSDHCTIDDSGNLCRKGACAYDKDGVERSCKCFFGMFWDKDENECKEDHAPCIPNPCLNNGTCFADEEDQFKCSCKQGYEGSVCDIKNWCMGGDVCENGVCTLNLETGIKLCKCNDGFFWNESIWECDDNEPPCIPNPCQNNGTCEPLENGTSNWKCECTSEYTGPACEIKDWCTSFVDGEVCANGICEVMEGSRKCKCNSGFYLDEMTQTCKEILNPCMPNPCFHDGICMPLSEVDYNCTCSDGYVGYRCTDLDYCVLDGGNAFCGDADCWNDPQLKLFFCSCDDNQYFDYTNRTCVDVDFCPLMKCAENEICKESTCRCDDDYEWNNSTGKCEPQLCDPDTCPIKDLICTQYPGTMEYRCSCEQGYAFNGTHCNEGANCVFPNLNSCNQICKILDKDTACSCLEEFFEMTDDNRTCIPTFTNKTCEKKACSKGTCVVTEDSEMCVCNPGYIEQDGSCVDLCSAGQLPIGFCPNNLCEATDIGFRCKCEGKYTLSDDRTTCTVRQVCQEGEIGWSTCSAHNAECMEDWITTEGYTCQCLDNQIKNPNGDCRDACNDAENQKMCSDLRAECDSTMGEVTCKCPPYFQKFQKGKVCNKPVSNSYALSLPLNHEAYKKVKLINTMQRTSSESVFDTDLIKVQKDVTSTLKSLLPGLLQTHILNCRENKNYILCKFEMQFSSVSDVDLKRLKLSENCLTVKDSISKCLLPPSLILQRIFVDDIVSYKKADPCDADIKDELCGSDTVCVSSMSKQSFNCTCKDGFEPRNRLYPFRNTESYIENCRDVDECLDPLACPHHMKCRNTIGSYTCSCKARYMLKDTANPNGGCVEICNPNPCLHGHCSSVGDHDFECSCDAGYSGLLCNLRDENFKKAWKNTIIVGAVLGGALLVTLILSFVYTSRLKKRKYSDAPDRMLYGTEMTDRRNIDSGTINNAFQK